MRLRSMTDHQGHAVLVDESGDRVIDLSRPPPEATARQPAIQLLEGQMYAVCDTFLKVAGEAKSQLADLFVLHEGGLRLLVPGWQQVDFYMDSGRRIAEGDLLAIYELSQLLTLLHGEALHENVFILPELVDDTAPQEQCNQDNLILVGGPVSNVATLQVTNEFQRRWHDQRKYCFDGITLRDQASQRAFATEFSTDGSRITRDYGLFARFPNPFCADGCPRRVWLFAGCHSAGTLAAVDALSNLEIVHGLRNLGDNAFFEVIFEGNWGDSSSQYPSHITIVAGPHKLDIPT